MEIKTMETSALEERKLAIAEEIEKEGVDLDTLKALEDEVRSINEELETRKQTETKKVELRKAVATGKGEVKEEFKEENKMEVEIRNTKAYIDAFAEYVKTGDDKEVRKLLTENGSANAGENDGLVAVPEFVYEEVKRAWDTHPLLQYVRKTYIKGNLKVGFEVSATDAVVHAEGSGAVEEEKLLLGIVNIIPANVKKWISVSDEVMDMRGEGFLRYIYAELTHKIAQKVAEDLLTKIIQSPATSSANAPAVPVLTQTAIDLDTIAKALALLSDEASNPIIVMSKQMRAEFRSKQLSAKYAVDPFEGLTVVEMNVLGTSTIIVGDFDYGAIANFPAGEDIKFNFDDKTLATADLVRIIGREFVGLGVVAPNAFVKVTVG